MSGERAELWNRLSLAGVVEGELPEAGEPESPWYIKVLLAISGWLAALFLIGFLGVGFSLLFNNDVVSLVVGCLMVGAAFSMLRLPKNEFYEHLALAVSLAGQSLIVFVLYSNLTPKAEWLALGLFQLMLALLMPNFVHRVFSAFFAAYGLSQALLLLGAPYVASSIVMFVAAWLWLHEFEQPRWMRSQRAIAYGLVLALIQIKGSALFGLSIVGWRRAGVELELWVQPWVGELLAGTVTLYVVWQLLQRLDLNLSHAVSRTALLATVVLVLVSMEARGITVGMLVLLLGFAGSNRVLMGLGVIALLFYISSYYYQLNATLLEKSQTLLLLGLVLLTARWIVLRVAAQGGEARHG